MKYLKTYYQVNESRKVTAVGLITRHRSQVIDFIEALNGLVSDQVKFCEDPVGSSKQVTMALDNLIANISGENGLEAVETVGELARLFKGGLAKSIAAIARPRMGEFAGGDPLKMSQEVVASIRDHMISKYDRNGEAVMQAIAGLLQELQVTVEPFCEAKNQEQ